MSPSFHITTAKNSIRTAKNRQLIHQVLESEERERSTLTCTSSSTGASISQTRTHPIRMQYEIKAPPIFIGGSDAGISAPSVKDNENRQKLLRQYICLNFCSTNGNQIQVLFVTNWLRPSELPDKLMDSLTNHRFAMDSHLDTNTTAYPNTPPHRNMDRSKRS